MSREPLQYINPPTLGKPSGFSHAVRKGHTIYLAGQTALNADGRIVGTTVVEQFEQALGNFLAALRGAGGTPEGLASVTIYIVDMEDYKAHARDIGQLWKRMVGTNYPAMAGIGVARLWDVEALVELQGIALVD